MKKMLLYFFTFVFICFLLPAMLTNVKNKNKEIETTSEETSEEKEQEQEQQYDYTKYGTIKLLHKKTEEVEEIGLDDYLVNVVSAEMPASYEMEALKAQAVVARTYTIYKAQEKKHENADICDDSSCCQAWISKEDRLAKWEKVKEKIIGKKLQIV